ncbi:LIM domain protein, partial [Ostertagia ostertagi]
DMTADEAPKDCAVCGRTVYPVERVFANKQLYHNQCFKCAKCEKKLTPTNYNSHQGVLLCKVHMLEVFHPEIAKTMDPANTE